MRMWHLLARTAGFTYGFHHSLVDEMYRNAGYQFGAPKGMDRTAAVDTWAEIPLLFQPGTEWNYGVSTDVLGRVVEVLSGRPLDAFFAEQVFAPLGMPTPGSGSPGTTTGWPRCTAEPARGLRRYDLMGDAPPAGRASCPVAAGWSPPRGLPPLHPDAAPRRRAGRRPAAGPADGGLHDPNHLPGART